MYNDNITEDTKFTHFVGVLRMAGGDCTNGGVTSYMNNVTLIGPGGPAEGTELRSGPPVLQLYGRKLGGRMYWVARPIGDCDGHMRMFGGNFIWSSDSRFRELSEQPIAVHDRIER